MTPNEPSMPKREPSLATLLADFTGELTTLVRQEATLIKAEVSEKVSETRSSVVSLAVGAAGVFAGFLVLLSALVAGVGQALGPVAISYPWLSALIVGTVVIFAGAALLQKGRSRLKENNLLPARSGESLRRDSRVLKEQLR